jgi:hypothetical protein
MDWKPLGDQVCREMLSQQARVVSTASTCILKV